MCVPIAYYILFIYLLLSDVSPNYVFRKRNTTVGGNTIRNSQEYAKLEDYMKSTLSFTYCLLYLICTRTYISCSERLQVFAN